jgi:hypothetical protein
VYDDDVSLSRDVMNIIIMLLRTVDNSNRDPAEHALKEGTAPDEVTRFADNSQK